MKTIAASREEPQRGPGLDLKRPTEPLGLYIHIPFCQSRCAYCDFLLFAHDERRWAPYQQALLGEIASYKETELAGATVDTLYFGGGTPSLLSVQSLEEILQALDAVFDLSLQEFTLEANPESLTRDQLQAYVGTGMTRLSLGVQTSSARLLQLLGRHHQTADVLQACDWARQAGLEDLNLDFISGLPGQTPADIDQDLALIRRLAPQHLSWYSLILEDRTYLKYLYDRGDLQLLDEEASLAMDRQIREGLADQGLVRYEISNFARAGFASRHNKKYWTGRPYLGLGLGAASYLNHERWTNTRDLARYIEQGGRGEGIRWKEDRSRTDDCFEQVMMGLRLVEGIDRQAFAADQGSDPLDLFPQAIAKHRGLGNLDYDPDRLFLTDQGLDLQNVVLVDLMEELYGDE